MLCTFRFFFILTFHQLFDRILDSMHSAGKNSLDAVKHRYFCVCGLDRFLRVFLSTNAAWTTLAKQFDGKTAAVPHIVELE